MNLLHILKEIPNYPGDFARTDGTIWTYWRFSGRGPHHKRWRVDELCKLEPFLTKDHITLEDKYLIVYLYKGSVTVHTLMLETFRGPCPSGMEGCHNDGNKLNNYIDNLRWDTKSNNQQDRKKHSTHQSYTVLTVEQVKEIKSTIIKRGTITDLSKKFHVTPRTIANIIYGRTWTDI